MPGTLQLKSFSLNPAPFLSLSPQGHNTCPPDTGCVCSVVFLKGLYCFKEKNICSKIQSVALSCLACVADPTDWESLKRMLLVAQHCAKVSVRHFRCFPGLEALISCLPLVAPPGKWAVIGSAQQTLHTQLTSLS